MFYWIKRLARAAAVKLSIVANRSDYRTWGDRRSLDQRWGWRTEKMATLVGVPHSVLELGAGEMRLRGLLPRGTQYIPSDLVRRSPDTVVVDLNHYIPGALPTAEVVVCCGVLEYVIDIRGLLGQVIRDCDCRRVLFTYCTKEDAPSVLYRRAMGWVNDYSTDELVRLASVFGRAEFLHREKKNAFFSLTVASDG